MFDGGFFFWLHFKVLEIVLLTDLHVLKVILDCLSLHFERFLPQWITAGVKQGYLLYVFQHCLATTKLICLKRIKKFSNSVSVIDYKAGWRNEGSKAVIKARGGYLEESKLQTVFSFV